MLHKHISQFIIFLFLPFRLAHGIFLIIDLNLLLHNFINIQPAGICHEYAIIQHICEFFFDFFLFSLIGNICTAPLEYFEEFCGLQGNGNRQIFWIVELFPVTVISEFQNLFYCFFCHFSYSCSAAFFNASLNWSSHAYMYKPFTPRVIRTRISCFSNSFAKFCFVPSSMVLFLVTFPLLVSLGS